MCRRMAPFPEVETARLLEVLTSVEAGGVVAVRLVQSSNVEAVKGEVQVIPYYLVTDLFNRARLQ